VVSLILPVVLLALQGFIALIRLFHLARLGAIRPEWGLQASLVVPCVLLERFRAKRVQCPMTHACRVDPARFRLGLVLLMKIPALLVKQARTKVLRGCRRAVSANLESTRQELEWLMDKPAHCVGQVNTRQVMG
jgi:hypothetical protein